MEIRAVAFDLDGTLYPAAALTLRAARLGVRHPDLLLAFVKVRRDLRILARLPAYRENAPCDGDEFRKMQGALVAKLTGRPENQTVKAIADILYRDMFELFSGIKPYPGVRPALEAIRARGLAVGLLSDLPPGRKLELLGLGDVFDVVMCSEDTGYLKPEPQSFLRLATGLGSPPEQILYVGNNPRYDVAGAKNAGMRTAIVSRRKIGGADLSFHDWNKLVRFIECNSIRLTP